MNKDRLTADLRRISRSAARLSSIVEEVYERCHQGALADGATPSGLVAVTPVNTEESLAGAAQALLQDCGARPTFGAPDIFGAPTFELLLELFVAEEAHKPVPATNACLSLGGAQTTALRWLETLERRGLVESVQDPKDGRRRLIRLSRSAANDLRAYLAGLRRRNGFDFRINLHLQESAAGPAAPVLTLPRRIGAAGEA